jgi:hypothetical protein
MARDEAAISSRSVQASHQSSRLLINENPRNPTRRLNHPFSRPPHPLNTTIHLLLLYLTMATPTFFGPPPTAEEMVRSLEQEVQRQQEATPEPNFQDKIVEQSYGCAK